MDDLGQPRVADFGLSKIIDSQGLSRASSFSGKGSVRWQAPELLSVVRQIDGVPNAFVTTTTKSDVYAFSFLGIEVRYRKIILTLTQLTSYQDIH